MKSDEHKTEEALAARLLALSPEKRALLERGRGLKAALASSMQRRGQHSGSPLSFAQQRLWFLDQWEEASALYNVPRAMRLHGVLHEEILQKALHTLSDRHESLRTIFVPEDGQPMQVIRSQQQFNLAIESVESVCEPARLDQAIEIARGFLSRPFHLSEGPLWRVGLIRLSARDHLLVLVMHHIITDGWSVGVLLRELSECYRAGLEGRAPRLEELPVQYADYALWQRERLKGEVLEEEIAYWRKQLAGMSVLELPTDHPRAASQSYRGARQPVRLSVQTCEGLKDLGRARQSTLYMVLLSAFATLLSRYSAQEDIAIGSPIAGRNHPQVEGLIGFFVNTLVLRANVSGEPTFEELLGRIRETALDAYSHQELPFEKLVEELAPERDPSRNPLVQVMFALQNVPPAHLALPGIEATLVDLDTRTAKFDISLTLTETPEGLNGFLEYATDLFEPSTLGRMAGHFKTLLEGLLANPQAKLHELPLLSQAERDQILVQWNDTAAPYPQDQCVHQLVEKQAQRTPEAIAVVHQGQGLTYAQLNARANQLAHRLRELGAAPDERVGICLERSIDLVAGLLAILKSGAAYVPLDASYPAQRLAFMLEDSQPVVLLTDSKHQASLPPHPRTLCLDTQWPHTYPASNPLPLARPNHLAYLIYTSGSTGTPKGVAVEHQGIVRLVFNTNYVRLEADDAIAQISNVSFDATTFEVWGAWIAGARLCILDQEVTLIPKELAAALRANKVSVLFITTALFNEVLRSVPDAFKDLRCVLFGGEAGDPDHVRLAARSTPAVNFLNMYGPTECTTFATYYSANSLGDDALAVPIGRPISNTRAYILDAFGQPLPVGVPGELYLGGPGLARGYWNREDLTAQRFVFHRAGKSIEERLYRTGDRVKWLASGNIEFLGRFDNQVKLRGYRIEMGEIEATIKKLPHVDQALVLLREDNLGDKRLTAYVVGREISASSITQALKHLLPNYMMPSAVVTLDALPVTPNGKIDRLALPAPMVDRGVSLSNRGGASSNIELHLAKVWEDLLGHAKFGVTDSFFDVGGHSLLAPKLMDRIEKNFGFDLPLDTLWFKANTIRDLAEIVRRGLLSARIPEAVPIKNGTRVPLFCVHTMGGNLFHYYDLAKELHAEQPVFGLQARGIYGEAASDTSIESIAQHCIEAMRKVRENGPYLIAGFSSGGVVAFEMALQLAKAGHQVGMLALLDTFSPKLLARRQWQKIIRLGLRARSWRQIQEYLYFVVLHSLRLGRLRELRGTGEAHRWAHWSYAPSAYEGMADLFIAEHSLALTRDQYLGWRPFLKGRINVRPYPGKHGLMVKQPVVRSLGRELQAVIDSSPGRKPNYLA